LVDRFINPSKDDKDQPKTTVALDYRFARYASDTSASNKVLAHIYDLGGEDDGLCSVPVSPAAVGNLVLAVTVDLSEPHSVIPTLDKWLALLREQVSKRLDALNKESNSGAARVEQLEKAKLAPWAEHPDLQSVRPFPVPLIIFGAKCEVMNTDMDPEKKKGLCRALRHYSHVNGGHLVFSSTKDKAAMNNVRGVLRQLLFGAATKGAGNEQLDPAKPLYVAPGKDSLQQIGAPMGPGWGAMIAEFFPDPQPTPKGVKKTESEVLAEELMRFPESAVDGMVEQRIEELNQYRKQVERNQRLASEGVDGSKMASLNS